MANTKGQKLMHLNIHSLYKHYDELFLNCHHFNMILLGETWLNNSINDNVISYSNYICSLDKTEAAISEVEVW